MNSFTLKGLWVLTFLAEDYQHARARTYLLRWLVVAVSPLHRNASA